MLNFLRKLRRNEMKGTRYLKYAIGEIVLVVIGILIALSINNWNESKKHKKREIDLLLQLSEELTDTKRELDIDLRNANTYYQMTDSIIYYDARKSQHPLSYYFEPQGEAIFYNNSLLFGNRSTYTTLKSSGLEIIENSALRNNITDLYERRFKRTEVSERIIFDYEDRLVRMMERTFDSHFHEPTNQLILLPKRDQDYFENKEFQNALITLQGYRIHVIERYAAIDSVISIIQGLILEETNTSK